MLQFTAEGEPIGTDVGLEDVGLAASCKVSFAFRKHLVDLHILLENCM